MHYNYMKCIECTVTIVNMGSSVAWRHVMSGVGEVSLQPYRTENASQLSGADFLASALNPPRHVFGTQQAAEEYVQRSLLDMQNGHPRGENGGFATIFHDRSSNLYYAYGPDSVTNYGGGGSIPGMRQGLESHNARAQAELGSDAAHVSGGIVLNAWFHSLKPGLNGDIQLGRPR